MRVIIANMTAYPMISDVVRHRQGFGAIFNFD
jgi:hypothetical protein